jgi:hypothetical protein
MILTTLTPAVDEVPDEIMLKPVTRTETGAAPGQTRGYFPTIDAQRIFQVSFIGCGNTWWNPLAFGSAMTQSPDAKRQAAELRASGEPVFLIPLQRSDASRPNRSTVLDDARGSHGWSAFAKSWCSPGP